MARRNSNLKWEVPAWSPSPSAGSEALTFTIQPLLTDTSQGEITIIGPTDVETHDKEQLTLIRVVGSFRVATRSAAGAAGANAALKVRLHKGIEVNNSGLVITAFADPWDPLDAEEEFLWERTYDIRGFSPSSSGVVDYGQLGPALYDANPFWSEFDIKLKRTVRPPETLALSFGAKGTAADIVAVWAWIRCLVAV